MRMSSRPVIPMALTDGRDGCQTVARKQGSPQLQSRAFCLSFSCVRQQLLRVSMDHADEDGLSAVREKGSFSLPSCIRYGMKGTIESSL
jgi:hypothetical protein